MNDLFVCRVQSCCSTITRRGRNPLFAKRQIVFELQLLSRPTNSHKFNQYLPKNNPVFLGQNNVQARLRGLLRHCLKALGSGFSRTDEMTQVPRVTWESSPTENRHFSIILPKTEASNTPRQKIFITRRWFGSFRDGGSVMQFRRC